MMSISFAWTTEAFMSHLKCVTRRYWQPRYADRVWRSAQQNDGFLIATNRSPRFGGKPVGLIRLTQQPFKQSLSQFTEQDERDEGGLWGSAQAFVDAMGGPTGQPYVVKFIPFPRVFTIEEALCQK